MKIIHIDMTGPYTVGATYQENILPAEQVKLGHEVSIWTSTYEWSEGKLKNVGEQNMVLEDGVAVQRIKFVKLINEFITRKIRLCRGIYKKLENEKPDLIMVHDGQTASVLSVCKFIKKHPETRLIADSHSDCYNSATTIWSKLLLHKTFYKFYMHKLYNSAEKFFCISVDVKNSITKLYGLSPDKMEVLPLGGIPISDTDYTKYRMSIRKEMGIPDEGIHLIHSGKMSEQKDTFSLIKVFETINNDNVYLTLIGSASEELMQVINEVKIRNNRFNYISWVDGRVLVQYLCSGDVYVLPRAQSATVQNAMCARCAIEVYPYDNYKSFLLDDICYASSSSELHRNLEAISKNKQLLREIKNESYRFAVEKLNYSKQAEYILK